MGDIYNSLPPMLKVYWTLAIIASIIFVIQAIMAFIGLGTDTDTDFIPDDADSGFSGLFSFRNLINFLIGFGWSGVLFYNTIQQKWLLQTVCIAVGFAFIAIFLIVYKQISKLAQDNTFNIKDCLGINCTVYLRIPANLSGKGKVQISIHGSIHEIDAVSDSPQVIPTGAKVHVEQIVSQDTLLVKLINN